MSGTSAGNFATHDWESATLQSDRTGGEIVALKRCRTCGIWVTEEFVPKEPGEADGYYVVMAPFAACPVGDNAPSTHRREVKR